MAIIQFNNVERTFRQGGQDFVALKGINLEVGDREFVAIVGPSGCGKTTCMRMAAGLEHPTGGNVMVDREVVTRPGPDRAVVFQQFALFPWKTVWDNIEFGLHSLDIAAVARKRRIEQYIDLMGLTGYEKAYPHQLSGGMQQRVAIARALVLAPPLVLADEPTGNLDTKSSDEVFELMRRMHAELKTSFLIVTHDPRLAARCDRVIELVDGRIERDEASARMPSGR